MSEPEKKPERVRSKHDDHASMLRAGMLSLEEAREIESFASPLETQDSWSRLIMEKVVPRAVVLTLIGMTWLGGWSLAAVTFSGLMIVKELGFVDYFRGKNG